LRVETFFEGLGGDGTEFWAPVTAEFWTLWQRARSLIGGYGMRLIRLWFEQCI